MLHWNSIIRPWKGPCSRRTHVIFWIGFHMVQNKMFLHHMLVEVFKTYCHTDVFIWIARISHLKLPTVLSHLELTKPTSYSYVNHHAADQSNTLWFVSTSRLKLKQHAPDTVLISNQSIHTSRSHKKFSHDPCLKTKARVRKPGKIQKMTRTDRHKFSLVRWGSISISHSHYFHIELY